MKNKGRKYRVETETIQQAQTVEAHCNEIIFINKSGLGNIVFVDGMPLDGDQFILDGGHADEWNESRYVITATPATFTLVIRRKIYTN